MRKVVIIGATVILTILVLIIAASVIATTIFNYKIDKEIDEFLGIQIPSETSIVSQVEIEQLPEPVQNWLLTAGVLESERIYTVRSKQAALARFNKDHGEWTPLKAEQHFTVNEPGFIWSAKFNMAPFLHIAARDMYKDGKGNMLIKFQSLFTIADSTGYEMDQGTMVRYLAEIVWMPTAALEDYIVWEEIDEFSAKATMTYKDVSATGIFTFDEQGNPVHFIADRYGEFDGEFIMLPWVATMSEHTIIDGFKVPVNADITWKLDTGDYTWYSLEVTDIEFNNPVSYN
ncbi:DUF6920 family protein [Desulfuribacillus alkaliarsenatis]|uniref:Uncharacterized protein n=1 Tax=Desulfuribacillus alkaliarsenatis TaxID=766136 RepID=A0A1E5FYQ8_9FIRM|nr:DUF6544 family protein [Desulfuribacillus alkaliarsenatis]OEF95700.1 hypothetical protein BHF68_11375 [Desulfuribacillus alkaliarsenatis]